MRTATIKRKTKETDIEVAVNLDGTGVSKVSTGIGFFDHMLDLLARHSRIDIAVKADGDLHVDHHHTTEDVGIALGQAVKQALGTMAGIGRYASIHMTMDATLSRVVIDISGRAVLVFKAEFPRDKVGTFDTELVREWFNAFAMNAGVTLHVETLYGENSHHIAESCFKGLARALRMAVAIDPRAAGEVRSWPSICYWRCCWDLRRRACGAGRCRGASGASSISSWPMTKKPPSIVSSSAGRRSSAASSTINGRSIAAVRRRRATFRAS